MNDKERRYDEARGIIQEWVDKQGHKRCWYYPDLFNKLVKVFDIKPSVEPMLPPRDEFEAECKRYQDEEYNPQRNEKP